MGIRCSLGNLSYGNMNTKLPVDHDDEGRDIGTDGQVIQFNTKHEKMIHKLKNLKKRANLINDSDSTKEIEW